MLEHHSEENEEIEVPDREMREKLSPNLRYWVGCAGLRPAHLPPSGESGQEKEIRNRKRVTVQILGYISTWWADCLVTSFPVGYLHTGVPPFLGASLCVFGLTRRSGLLRVFLQKVWTVRLTGGVISWPLGITDYWLGVDD